MIRLEKIYLLRLTLKSGRQIDQWMSHYSVRTSQLSGELVALHFDPADGFLPRILAFSVKDVTAIQLIDQRRRVRFGRQTA